MAIGSLVCGILSFFTCGVLGLVAIVLGFLGLGKAKDLNGSGKGMAIGGLVTGALGILVGVVLLFTVILAGNAAVDTVNDAFCDAELSSLESAVDSYESTEGRRPDDLQELRAGGYTYIDGDEYDLSNGEIVRASGSDCPKP